MTKEIARVGRTETEIEAARKTIRDEATAWVAKLPATLTPADLPALADAAVTDARAAVGWVRDSFQGTLPPPPWPASPEIIAARDRVLAARDAAEVIHRRAERAHFKDEARIRVAFLRDVQSLYREAATLIDKVAELPKVPSTAEMARVLPAVREAAKGAISILGAEVPVWALAFGGYIMLQRQGRRAGGLF
jgi:hypothetical protein